VAGCTQTHEVVHIVGASLGQRLDVVYFLGWGDPSETCALLAERVCGNVPVADSFPSPVVAFLYDQVTLVLFILFVGQLLMFFAKPVVC